jgi:hypothetical protein
MARDGGSAGASPSADVLSAGGYTVNIDSLRATANVVLGLADRVDSVGERRAMPAAQEYGYALPAAATGWADRFSYLLDGLADEVEHAGFELCGTADAYTEVDVAAEARARQLGGAAW